MNERQKQILDIIQTEGFVSVQALCGRIFASPATIRRDLSVLVENNSIHRIFGGAVPISGNDQEVPYNIRLYRSNEEKSAIAQTAMQFIRNASTIILDSSTTCSYLAQQLEKFENLSVLTNGTDSLSILTRVPKVKVIATGGQVVKGYEFRGSLTRHSIERYNADLFFLSCCSLSAENGLTYTDEENASIKQLMAKRAQKKILLCDSSKFDQSSFFCAFTLDEFDHFVCDTAPKNPALREAMGDRLICSDGSHLK